MSEGPSPVCAACGSRHLRASRAHGVVERVERTFAGVGFHVCSECGARGSHRGDHRAHRVKRASASGRSPEPRDRRALRAHRARQTATILAAAALGAGLSAWAASCGGAF